MIICRKRDSTWKFATTEVGCQDGEEHAVAEVAAAAETLPSVAVWETECNNQIWIVVNSWQITEPCKLIVSPLITALAKDRWIASLTAYKFLLIFCEKKLQVSYSLDCKMQI